MQPVESDAKPMSHEEQMEAINDASEGLLLDGAEAYASLVEDLSMKVFEMMNQDHDFEEKLVLNALISGVIEEDTNVLKTPPGMFLVMADTGHKDAFAMTQGEMPPTKLPFGEILRLYASAALHHEVSTHYLFLKMGGGLMDRPFDQE